jgi:hypothetical protein
MSGWSSVSAPLFAIVMNTFGRLVEKAMELRYLSFGILSEQFEW